MASINSDDLNANEPRQASKTDGISDVDRRVVNEETLEEDADSKYVEQDCVHEAYKGSIDALTINDVSPTETARARFLPIVVDHFMVQHVVEVMDSEAAQNEQGKVRKRKAGVVRFEGDPQFVLPLMYVTNMYETLVKEVDVRLASLDGFQGQTIGVDVEAIGGLYMKLAKRFPEKGPLTFKRRELVTPAETRTRFPELVVQEERRVRLVVANGLDIVERPVTLSVADSEWFKKLTGRSEVFISAKDYKFYSSRHIYQRVVSNLVSSNTDLPDEDLGDLKILQDFITQANEYCYFERHRKAPGTDVVIDLVYSHPESLALLRAFPYVLIIDAIYRENRYKIPFFEVLGFTSTGKNFNVACAFISAEREDNYVWVLNQISELCWFVGETPKTIVTLTDPDQALFSAVENAFPHTNHLLGRHHIYKNIEDRCLKDTRLNNIATAFVSACKTLFESKTENVYDERLALMEHDWKSKEGLMRYLKQMWLTPYKDKIVSAWADKVLHFGTHTMNRVESSSRFDKSLKQRLSSSDSSYDDFEFLWHELNAEIKGQSVRIKMSFDMLSNDVPHNVKRIQELMKYELSDEAYGIMSQEYECVKSGDKYPSTCVCQLRVSHGLPCAHEMEKYVANQTEIPLEAIHQFWRQLNLNVDIPEDPCSAARAFLVDLFIMFREMSVDEKMRCKYAVKKIIQSCEEPPKNMTNDRSEDFFRKFFTCEWYSEPGLFSSEGVSSSEIWGQSRGSSTAPGSSGQGSSSSANSMASTPYVMPPYIHESLKQIPPQNKDKDPTNVTTSKDRYNNRDKSREEDLGNLAILQQFLSKATKHYCFNRHRKAPGTDVVTDLVFADSDALAVLRVFPYVLIIDATCKENRYNIPCFEVLGLTSKGKSFCVACAFIGAEREENYIWVLNQISDLCWFVGETPKTIVTLTDPDQALFNAVEQAFPHTNHLLGRHHIYKCIEDRCLKSMSASNIASVFVNACKSLFESKTENMYDEQLTFLENDWKSKPGLIGYLKQTWLMPYKDKIVSAWTDKALHFGTHTMNRVESALKKCLNTSDRSFDNVWFGLRIDLVSQINEIKFPVDWSPLTVPREVKKIGIFKSLMWSVSHKALKIMVEEYKCMESGDKNPSTCACQLRVSHGLPCAHEMAKYVADQTLIPPKAIHTFWRTSDNLWLIPDNLSSGARAFVLDLFIRFCEMIPSEQIRCEFAVNNIMQSVEEPPTSMTKDRSEDFLRKWFSFGWDLEPEKFSSEDNTSPQIPSMSMSFESCRSCIKPYSAKFVPIPCNKPYVEDPHVYERPLNQPRLKSANTPEKPSNKPYVEDPYIREIPSFMVPYVTDFYDDDACGHSGFQAIADGVEYGEHGWRWVRGDLFKELASRSDVYTPVFISNTVEQILKALAHWTMPAYLPEQQFSIPDMGHIVATHYQLVFVVLGHQCVTFLPLYVDDQASLTDMNELCLVYMHHGKKFISVTMDEGFPLPPVHPLWARHHRRSVDGLDLRYGHRLEKYKWFQSFMGPPPSLEKCD